MTSLLPRPSGEPHPLLVQRPEQVLRLQNIVPAPWWEGGCSHVPEEQLRRRAVTTARRQVASDYRSAKLPQVLGFGSA